MFIFKKLDFAFITQCGIIYNIGGYKMTQEEIKQIIIDLLNNDCNDVDLMTIDSLAFAFSTIDYMNKKLSASPNLLGDRIFMASREKLNNEIIRYSKALGLTREQRARISKLSDKKENSNPLLEILGED